VLDTLQAVAVQAGRPPAQVALAWAMTQPDVTTLLLGASRLEQLQDNLASLDLKLTPEQRHELDLSSALEPAFPYGMLTPEIGRMIFGGETVQGWR